jgi:glutamate-1-semialdehyde 2,1-aminomutase
MYQAGTLSGNPLAMAAGIKTLEILKREGTYTYLEQITKELAEGMLRIAHETGHQATGNQIGAMFGLFFTDQQVYDYETAKTSNLHKFARFHRGMLEHGVYLAPSQFEAGFTSLAHGQAEITATLEATKAVLSQIQP